MAKLQKPEGYQTIIPYLIIPNAEGFFKFMQNVFGATELLKIMRDDKLIMHAELKIDDSVVMYADSTKDYPPHTGAFMIYVEDADSSYQKALSIGGSSNMEPQDKDYGRTAGFYDGFGNTWWVLSSK